LFEVVLEVDETGDPRLRVLRDPAVVHQPDRNRIEVVVLLAPDLARRHQPGGFEHGQVLHDTEARQRRDGGAERDEGLTVVVEELVEKDPAARIGEGSEHVVHGGENR
jgi:hypothetical protein